MSGTHIALPRQITLFLVIGAAQLALDTAVFIGLTAAGVPVVWGNLAGRVAGACLGFWLNGRYTFADPQGTSRMQRRNMLRFVVAWVLMTAFTGLLLDWVADTFSLQGSWLAKPLVEIATAGISFVVWRQWVYR